MHQQLQAQERRDSHWCWRSVHNPHWRRLNVLWYWCCVASWRRRTVLYDGVLVMRTLLAQAQCIPPPLLALRTCWRSRNVLNQRRSNHRRRVFESVGCSTNPQSHHEVTDPVSTVHKAAQQSKLGAHLHACSRTPETIGPDHRSRTQSGRLPLHQATAPSHFNIDTFCLFAPDSTGKTHNTVSAKATSPDLQPRSTNPKVPTPKYQPLKYQLSCCSLQGIWNRDNKHPLNIG